MNLCSFGHNTMDAVSEAEMCVNEQIYVMSINENCLPCNENDVQQQKVDLFLSVNDFCLHKILFDSNMVIKMWFG